jgi:septal ring factor EnvC (AmiA/AmiB activator)
MDKRVTWLEQNWDKILTAVISTILSGVVGFFVAIRSIDSEISSIKQDITSLKNGEKLYIKKDDLTSINKDIASMQSAIDNMLKPSIASLDETRKNITAVEMRLTKVETVSTFIKEQSDRFLSSQTQTIQFTGGVILSPIPPRSR